MKNFAEQLTNSRTEVDFVNVGRYSGPSIQYLDSILV